MLKDLGFYLPLYLLTSNFLLFLPMILQEMYHGSKPLRTGIHQPEHSASKACNFD